MNIDKEEARQFVIWETQQPKEKVIPCEKNGSRKNDLEARCIHYSPQAIAAIITDLSARKVLSFHRQLTFPHMTSQISNGENFVTSYI